jgi:predicted metal-binding protein
MAKGGLTKMEKRFEDYLESLCQKAIELGAAEAAALEASDIVVDERAALKCRVPVCPYYGVSLMCPPNIMPVTEFKRIVKLYRGAVLIKVINNYQVAPMEAADRNSLSGLWQIAGSTSGAAKPGGAIASYLQAIRQGQGMLYDIIDQIESLCLKAGYTFTAGLSAGSCSLCEQCVGVSSGLPCRHPFRARPSIEGLGVDAIATARKAGITLGFNQQNTSWVGLVLVD